MKFLLGMILPLTIASYLVGIQPPNDSCSSLPTCPEEGQPCNCPDGTPSTWTGKVLEIINTELCSCFTPGCGPGPCNRRVKWTGNRSEYRCDCGEASTVKICFEDFLFQGATDQSCALASCSGPCLDLVNPAP